MIAGRSSVITGDLLASPLHQQELNGVYVTTQIRSIPTLDHLFFLDLNRSDTDAPQVACLRVETNKPESIMDTVILQATFPQRCDALGRIGTTFRELEWKTLIFFERAGPDKSERMLPARTRRRPTARRPPPRVISDCHFTAQLNHFIPVLLAYSVTVFLK